VVLLALASPLWLAGRGFGAEIGSALGLVVATVLARRALNPEAKLPLWLSVVGLGVATLFRPSALAFGLAWIVWLWRRPRRDWLTVGIALLLVAALVPAYNWIRYGNIFESGYGEYGSGFSLQITGLVGYLFAPGRSLILFAPWTLLVVPQVILLFRRQFNWETGIAAGVLGFYLAHSMWREWEGGWSFGPRLLIPILPVIALLVVPRIKNQLWAVLLFLPGSLLQVAALAIDPTTTHLKTIVQEGLTFEEMVSRWQQTVWSVDGNIAALQLKAVATPDYFVWLALWFFMAMIWIASVFSMAKPVKESL
jgi:hypothetical protein